MVWSFPWEMVWDTLLHPESELELLQVQQPQQSQQQPQKNNATTTTTTLQSLHRTETGPIHRGSTWREERIIHHDRWMLRKGGQTISSLITVTDLTMNSPPLTATTTTATTGGSGGGGGGSITYSMSMPDTHDVDLQGGTIVKTIHVQPYHHHNAAETVEDSLLDEKKDDIHHVHHNNHHDSSSPPHSTSTTTSCLVVISYAFYFDTWYGCLEEYCCRCCVMRLARYYLDIQFHELQASVQIRQEAQAQQQAQQPQSKQQRPPLLSPP